MQSARRYTFADIGAKQVPTVGKEAKDGFTVMVANAGDGTIMPFVLITKGTTHQSLKKFVKPLHPEFALASGGAMWPTSK